MRKLKMIIKLLFSKHAVLLTIDRSNLIRMLEEKEFDTKMTYTGLRLWNVMKVVGGFSQEDVVLEKAKFDQGFDEFVELQKDMDLVFKEVSESMCQHEFKEISEYNICIHCGKIK